MALIKCPKCAKQISDKALVCPHCGFEVQKVLEEIHEKERQQREEQRQRQRVLVRYQVAFFHLLQLHQDSL